MLENIFYMTLVDIEDSILPVNAKFSEVDISVGIDFGTTNSIICFNNGDKTIFFSDKDGFLIPSVVAIHKSHKYVFVGRDAMKKIGDNDYGIVFSVKRLISSLFDIDYSEYNIGQNVSLDINKRIILIFDKEYTVEDLVSYIIAYLKQTAEANGVYHIKSCVITVPANFDDISRLIIKLAAEANGINVLRIINEPTAAIFAYNINKKNGIYLVYDLGGGTLDVSIVRIQDEFFQIISNCGDLHIGGDDIDLILFKYICKKINKELLFDKNRIKIKQLKHDISKHKTGKIIFDDGIYCEVSISEFDKIIQPFVEKTMLVIRNALRFAKKNETDLLITGVVLVGGSTRIDAFKKRIQNEFEIKDVFDKEDPDVAIAIGAAKKAYNIRSRSAKYGILIDVVPLSIGIETIGGFVEWIIKRNTPIPASVSIDFTTFKDNQTGIDLNIVQGEMYFAKDCVSIGKILIRNIIPMSAGLAKVTVNFFVNEDGILKISTLDHTNMKEKSLIIGAMANIDIDYIKTTIQDSIKYSKKDV